jgi:hypothetical protein
VIPWPGPAALEAGDGPQAVLLRISAQRYNTADEYGALAEALARRLQAPSSPRSLLGRLRRG